MKKLLLMFAAVGMLFTACNKETNCGHDFIEYDPIEALIGTWTYVADNGQAEAMVINPDGSFEVTGIMQGGYLYEEKGTISVVNNKVSLVFEGDTDVIEGRLELVSGKSMSIVLNEEYDIRLDYDYCENDLSDEIIGMWVCNEGVAGMAIQTYQEDGKCIYTGFSFGANDYMTNFESTYEVFGDMLFQKTGDRYFATRLTYLPNGNSLGDILTTTSTILINDKSVTSSYSFLRIKQNLDLNNKNYDYNNIYVTNVKAKDAEFEFAGQTLNLATMDGRILDKMMKNLLFNVSFPSANEIVYNYHYNGENIPMPAPIVVDGNKMTIKKSVNNPIYKDIDVWTFQDQDNTQMHIYMPTYAFENFLANTAVEMMAQNGELDLNDTEAVAAIYDGVADAIETINVSFIFKTAK